MRAAARDGVRTLVLSNPNNPTGVLHGAEQLHEIATIANRHGDTVVVDEIYPRLVYPGHRVTTSRTTACSSPSAPRRTAPPGPHPWPVPGRCRG
ncbi:hypothetical protein BJF90_13940 [Pseudonocardia sp. CNS-004]|nr:hypothetical protein BJF90_13940 [Pseudonocardia sp. CNS-004]